MHYAIHLAKKNQTPYAAIILTSDYKLLAASPNTVSENNDVTAHAEINAIRMAGERLGTTDLHDCILVTTCEPCPMCASAVVWSGIQRVYFGLSIQQIQQKGHRQIPLNSADIYSKSGNGIYSEGGLFDSEVLALFDNYKKAKS